MAMNNRDRMIQKIGRDYMQRQVTPKDICQIIRSLPAMETKDKVVMSQASVLTRVVGSNKYLCNVCNEEMHTDKGFAELECENGHLIGELDKEGMAVIRATVKKETHA